LYPKLTYIIHHFSTRFIVLAMILQFISCKNNLEKASNTTEGNTNSPENKNEQPKNFVGCGYNYRLKIANLSLTLPQQREEDQIKNILSYSGVPLNFEIYCANIDNAVATTIDNKRYIIYDPSLLRGQDKLSNGYWSSRSILAHEIGHHLSGHLLKDSSSDRQAELEADTYSGFILYKMGATLQQASFAVQKLGSESDTKTHPNKSKRLIAIKNGYEAAKKQRFDAAIPPPPEDDQDPLWGKGYMDEFTHEGLVSTRAREDGLRIRYSHNFNTPPIEGIIIDVQKIDTVDLYDYLSIYFNMEVTILITRNDDPEDMNGSKRKGAKVTFHIYDYGNLCSACASNFRSLMVPGRKIRFKSYYYGYWADDIYYVKKLKR
jgi:hypothetical protein